MSFMLSIFRIKFCLKLCFVFNFVSYLNIVRIYFFCSCQRLFVLNVVLTSYVSFFLFRAKYHVLIFSSYSFYHEF